MNGHPRPEALAQLVDGGVEGEEREALVRHVAVCRTCAAAYSDAVRVAAERGVQSGTDRLDSCLWSAAIAIGPQRPVARRRATRVRVGLAAAFGTIALAFVVGRVGWFAGEGRLDLAPGVRAALEASAAVGFVLPGGELGAAGVGETVRSGGADPELADQPEVRRTLAQLEVATRRADASAAAIATLIATAEPATARAYVDEALVHHPRDARLRVLSAGLHHQRGELEAAESDLRRALEIAPRAALARLDLAIVLRARGEEAAAVALFRELASDGRSPLGARARRELRSPSR